MELNPQLTDAQRAFAQGCPSGPRPVADRGVELERWFGRPDPREQQVRKYEQPWHRNAAYMIASGKYSAKAVAEACEKTKESVYALMRNAWFQETVAEIQKQNGAGDIMDVFRAECMSSLTTLIELRDNPATPPAVKRLSAIDILHQVLGKPTQRVEMEQNISSSDPVAEVARLEADNLRMTNEHVVRVQGSALSLSD